MREDTRMIRQSRGGIKLRHDGYESERNYSRLEHCAENESRKCCDNGASRVGQVSGLLVNLRHCYDTLHHVTKYSKFGGGRGIT